MNIALFSDTYPPEINGVATSTYNLAKTLRDHGNNVLVVTTNNTSKKLSLEDGVLRIPGISVKALYGYKASGPYNHEAMKIIAAFQPDVVHCQTDAGIGIFGQFVSSNLHIGKVYTYHTMIEDYAYYVTKGHFDRFARHAVRWFFRGKSSIFDEFIAPSDKSKDYLRSIGIDSTISVVPTGIELSRFDPSNEDKEETKALKAKFGIAPDDFVILSLGRIAKEKSIDVLIRGYKLFLDKKPTRPTKLVITGWGPAEKELQSLASNLGIADHVIFTGKCAPSETQKYYHLGDCFASASLSETQGLTFMEGMAANLVVIARYDDNLVGTIKDGETGYFFFSEQDFADRIESVISMSAAEKKRIVANGLKAIDFYSMERFYQNVMQTYERVWKKNW